MKIAQIRIALAVLAVLAVAIVATMRSLATRHKESVTQVRAPVHGTERLVTNPGAEMRVVPPLKVSRPSLEVMRAFNADASAATEIKSLLAGHPEFGLTEEQKTRLLIAYVEVVTAKNQFEASIATATEVSPTETYLEIPKYDGMPLQKELHAAMEEIVGKSKTDQIQQEIGPILYAQNLGFGATEQKIDITLTDSKNGLYTFVRGTTELTIAYKQKTIKSREHGRVDVVARERLDRWQAYAQFLPKGGAKS